jgi:intein/homing endonuclease
MEKTLAKSRERSLKLILIKSDPLLNYGINQKRGESGIRNIGLNLFYLQLSKRLIKYVIFAKKYIHCQKQKLMRVNFVATLANPLTEENKEWITFKNNVLYVEKNSLQINILKLKHVAFTAEQSSVTVIAIEEDGYQDVYNLEVENDHNYTIENGIVTHNCIDSIRYGLERLMKRRVIDYSKWRE